MYVDKHIPKINVVSSTNLQSPLHGLMLKFAIVLGLKSVYIKKYNETEDPALKPSRSSCNPRTLFL